MTATDPRCAMLSELSGCAHRLGMAFGREAERAEDMARTLEYFRVFERCFFAVRVAIALELRLARASAAAFGEEREGLHERPDPPETEGPERGETGADRERFDYDRDHEREPANLPLLLATLEGVCADAAALPGPEPADLPTLRQILAHVTSDPPLVAAPPKPAASLRARLSGSGAAALAFAPLPPNSS